MFHDDRCIKVGAVVTSLIVAAVLAVLLVDVSGGGAVRVRLFFAHPGALQAGADIQLGGRKIGVVRTVRQVSSREARRPQHPLHPLGGVVCGLELQPRYLRWLHLNSEYFVNAKGFLGESYLEVAPTPAGQAVDRNVREGDGLRGVDPARMEQIIVTSFANAQRFRALFSQLQPDMDLLMGEMERLRETLDGLGTEGEFIRMAVALVQSRSAIAQLQATFAQAPSVDSLWNQGTRFVQNGRVQLATLARDIDGLQAQIAGLASRFPHRIGPQMARAIAAAENSMATLSKSVAALQTLGIQVAKGQGSVGALMNDPEFSDDAKKIGKFIKRHPWKIMNPPAD